MMWLVEYDAVGLSEKHLRTLYGLWKLASPAIKKKARRSNAGRKTETNKITSMEITTQQALTVPAEIREAVLYIRFRYSHILHGGKSTIHGPDAIRDVFETFIAKRLKESYPSADISFFASEKMDKEYLDLLFNGNLQIESRTGIATDLTVRFWAIVKELQH
jgi:hypothetical protein